MQTRSSLPGHRALRRIVLAALLAACVVLAPAAEARIQVRAGQNYRLAMDPRPVRGKDAVGFAVDPRDPRHIVEVNADWLNGECQYADSRDGGRTWHGRDLQAPQGFSDAPCTVGPHLAAHMEASVQFGGGDRVYTTFVSPAIGAGDVPQGKSVLVARSDNGGRSFKTASLAIQGGPNTTQGPDYVLPKLAVDPGRRRDRIYVVAGSTEADHSGGPQREDSIFAISNNNGSTWSPPIRANAADENAIEQSQPVVGRDHTVYVTWRTRGKGAAPGQFTPQGFVTLAKSTDRGKTWTESHVANVTGYQYLGPPTPPFTTDRTFTGSTFPRLAIDHRNDHLYLVYGDGYNPTLPAAKAQAHAADHFIAPNDQVFFQASTDGGAHWTPPEHINEPSPVEPVTQTRHPNVSVAPNGRVDVVWNDRRHWYRGCVHTHVACQEERLGDTYYAYSTNGGRSFSRNFRITDRSEGLDVGYDYRFGTGWAYGPFSVPLGNDRILVGWMDSREGNFETDTQDIYLSRVDLNARGRVPVQGVRGRNPEDTSVRLSRMTYPGGSEAVLAGTFVTRPWARPVIVNDDDPASALAGVVLARANIAPVLVSGASGLDPGVKREIRRLRPLGAYVLGDESALSAQVVSDLTASGVPSDQVTRLSGGSPAGTAALVAQAMDRRTADQKAAGAPAFDAAIVVNPADPGASTVASWATNRRLPVLFSDRDSVPQPTKDALAALGITRTFVVGGTRFVSDAAAGSLPGVTRVGSNDRFATSRSVARTSRQWGLPVNMLYLTSGDPMTTALVGGAAGRLGGILAITRDPVGDAQRTARQLRLANLLDRIVVVDERPPTPPPTP